MPALAPVNRDRGVCASACACACVSSATHSLRTKEQKARGPTDETGKKCRKGCWAGEHARDNTRVPEPVDHSAAAYDGCHKHKVNCASYTYFVHFFFC